MLQKYYFFSYKFFNRIVSINLISPSNTAIKARYCLLNSFVYAFMDFEEAKNFKPSLVFPNEKNNTLT